MTVTSVHRIAPSVVQWTFSEAITNTPTVVSQLKVNGASPTGIGTVVGNVLTVSYAADSTVGDPWNTLTGTLNATFAFGGTLALSSGVLT